MQAHGIKAEIAQNQRHPDRTACVSNVTLNKQESLLIRVYTTPPPLAHLWELLHVEQKIINELPRSSCTK